MIVGPLQYFVLSEIIATYNIHILNFRIQSWPYFEICFKINVDQINGPEIPTAAIIEKTSNSIFINFCETIATIK